MKSTLTLTLLALALLLVPATVRAQMTPVPITEWNAIGPFGAPEFKNYPQNYSANPRDERDYRGRLYWYKLMLTYMKNYPMSPDGAGQIDLDATYSGDQTINGAGQQLTLAWKKIQGLGRGYRYPAAPDLFNGCGVSYFSTWIQSPEVSVAKFTFNGYSGEDKKGNGIMCWVNGSFLPTTYMRRDVPLIQQVRGGADVSLRKGWNHIFVCHISGWKGTCNALVMEVPESVASGIVVSAEPPAEVGRKFSYTGLLATAGATAAAPTPAAPRPAAARPAAARPAAVPPAAPKPAPAPASPTPVKAPRQINIF